MTHLSSLRPFFSDLFEEDWLEPSPADLEELAAQLHIPAAKPLEDWEQSA